MRTKQKTRLRKQPLELGQTMSLPDLLGGGWGVKFTDRVLSKRQPNYIVCPLAPSIYRS